MKITKIAPQAKNPNRVNVYADDKFYCGLDLSVALNLGLKPGMTVDDELSAHLSAKEEFARGFDYALRVLQRAGQSRRQMLMKLQRRCEDPRLIKQIMDRLIEAGLLDDNRLAEQWTTRLLERNKSPREIRLLLIKKGIEPALVNELTEKLREYDNTPAITKLARVKWTRLKDTDERVRYQKTAAYLVGKGFGYGEVKVALAQMELGSKAEDLV
jgi:regulatory protein